MDSRTITAAQSGPVTLDIVLPSGRIAVRADSRTERAELTVQASEDALGNAVLSWDSERATLLAEVSEQPCSSAGSHIRNVVHIGSGSVTVLGDIVGGDLVISDDRLMVTEASIHGPEIIATVPEGSSLRVRTKTASLDAAGEFASVEAKTVSGAVTVAGTVSLTVETTSGSVRAAIVDGRASVETVSGKIHLGRADQVSARSKSGRISVDDFGGTADLWTISGAISLHAAEGGTVTACSASGSITVTANATALAEGLVVRAESGTGRVSVPQPAHTTTTKPRRPRRTVEAM